MTVGEEFGSELLANLIRRAEALQRTLDSLPRETPHPSEARTALIRLLRELNRAIATRLEELRAGPPPPDFADIENAAKRLGVVQSIISRLIGVVSQTEHGAASALIPALEAMARRFTDNALVLIQYLWPYNFGYENLGKIFRDWIRHSGLRLPTEPPEHLIVLGFPATERPNTLLHCAFAHELGHFITQSESLDSAIPVTINPGLYQAVPPDQAPKVFDVTLSWYRELFSDVLGLHLIGPAYVFAFSEFSLQALNTPGAKHPPPHLRLSWMLQLMRDYGYIDKKDATGAIVDVGSLSDDLKDYFEKLHTFLAANAFGKQAPFYHCILDAVGQVLGHIKSEVETLVADKGYTPQKFREEVEPLVQRLLRLVPPAEGDGVPRPSFVSILNAGWVVKRVRTDELEAIISAERPEEKREVQKILNDLVYKAIEYLVIKETWSRS